MGRLALEPSPSRLTWRLLLGLLAIFSLPQVVVAQTAPRSAASSRLFTLHPQSAEQLRELFRCTGEPLPVVSAHRGGARPGFPENCLATFEHTLQHSFAMLEIDPRYTRDGAIVVHHDATLDRTTTGKGLVAERTLKELKELRLKDSEGNITPYQIPTLDEVLQWARGKTILVLDSKDVSIEARVRKIEQHHAQSYAMLIVGSPMAARECYALNQDIMMEVMVPDRERFRALEKAGVPWSNVIAFVGHEPSEDEQLLEMLHDKGVCVMGGTSRNLDRLLRQQTADSMTVARDYHMLRDRGIDLIETDLPIEVWQLLYADVEVPASKSHLLSRPSSAQER